MDREALLDRVGTELFGYLMEGELSRDEFAGVIRPEELSERYNEYDSLAALHFVLSEPVVSFVRRLPERLRQLKTETTRQQRVTDGAIQGRIEWNETYRRRVSQGTNGAQYVCSRREETRVTPENVLLKYVVEQIAETLGAAEQYFETESTWVMETWDGEPSLRKEFLRLRNRNVHLQSLPVPDEADMTDRMVRKAETARQPLYRQAAMLYDLYRDYIEGDEEVLRAVLADATVLPEDEADLFELYVLFELINSMTAVGGERVPTLGDPTLNTLLPGRRGPAAVFDGEQEFNLFYDQSGQALQCSFSVEPEVSPEEYSRSDAATVYGDRAAESLFHRGGGPSTKRPDVLVAPTHPRKEPTQEYLVVEVKYSTRKATIKSGIRELAEYLAYFRRDGSPVFERRGYMGSGINGLLVVGDRDDIPPPEAQTRLPITVVPASDLPTVLPELLVELFVGETK